MKSDIVAVDHPIVQKKINKSLRLSIKEGSLASISSSFSLSYFSPAALIMNATNVQMGILYAIVSLLPSMVQLKTTTFIGKFSRKQITLVGSLGKIILILPLLAVGYLHWMGFPYMVWAFIGFVGLYYICTAIVHPAWFSWMGAIVPKERRGNYFSKRNKIAGFFGVVAMIAGAIILDRLKRVGGSYGDAVGFTLIGFGILFVLSGLFRFGSWALLRKIYEPRIKIRKKDNFSFIDFLRQAKNTPFGRFSLFAGVFTFMVGISGPYWAVYMLSDLNLSYIWYVAITVSSIIFQLVFLPLLGKFSDKFGNVRLIQTSSLIAGIFPFIFIMSALIGNDLGMKIYLLIVPSIVGGFGWAGYNLALNNYVYDAVSNRKQGFGLSYMNLLVGIGGFAGAGIGILITWMDISFMNPMLFIFAVSGIGRLIVAVYGSKFLHEVRHVGKFSSQFWVREFAPAHGIVREVHHLGHIAEKVEHYVIPGERREFENEKRAFE